MAVVVELVVRGQDQLAGISDCKTVKNLQDTQNNNYTFAFYFSSGQVKLSRASYSIKIRAVSYHYFANKD